MGSFLRGLAKQVAVVDISEASANHQLNRRWFLRSEGEMQGVVSIYIGLQQLSLDLLGVGLIDELTTTDGELGPIADLSGELAELHGEVLSEVFVGALLSNDGGHQRRSSLVDSSEWCDLVLFQDMPDKSHVTSETGPVEVVSLGLDLGV